MSFPLKIKFLDKVDNAYFSVQIPKLKSLIMRKSYRYLAAWLMAGLFSIAAYGQTVTVTGTVRNNNSKESVSAVSVLVKGTNQGTFTNSNGEFSLTVAKLPVTLVFTSAGGYDPQEVTVSDASKKI